MRFEENTTIRVQCFDKKIKLHQLTIFHLSWLLLVKISDNMHLTYNYQIWCNDAPWEVYRNIIIYKKYSLWPTLFYLWGYLNYKGKKSYLLHFSLLLWQFTRIYIWQTYIEVKFTWQLCQLYYDYSIFVIFRLQWKDLPMLFMLL